MRSPAFTINPFGEDEKPSGMIKRLRAAGREVANDPGVQAGIAQIVASLAALAIRSFSPNDLALTRTPRNEE